MIKIFSKLIIFSAIADILAPCFLYAANCPGNVNEYLDMIESYKPLQSDSTGLISFVKCIYEPVWNYVEHPDSLWDPDFDSTIFERTWKDRERVIRDVAPLAKSADDSLRLAAAAALAYYNYPPSNQILKYYPDGPFKAVLYAILNDTVEVGWTIDRYLAAEKLAGTDPETSLRDRMIYLGLLYHIAMPNSVPFINELIQNEKSVELNNAAAAVKRRITLLNPIIE